MRRGTGPSLSLASVLLRLTGIAGPRVLRFLLIAVVLSLLGAGLIDGTLISLRYAWRQAFAPWSHDRPDRPALLGLWRGDLDLEGQHRLVLLNLDYRFHGTREPYRGPRANLAGWLAFCDGKGRMTSADAIQIALGRDVSRPFRPMQHDDVVQDPVYRFHFAFTWTGSRMELAAPFARRQGEALVSSTADPTPAAVLHRMGGPVADGPACP